MRIAQIAPPWVAVPPTRYGGLESVVATLTDGLVERGHDVTLFAAGPSSTSARADSYHDRPLGTATALRNPGAAVAHVRHAYARRAEFDVIHDHTVPDVAGPRCTDVPVVRTVHVAASEPGWSGRFELAAHECLVAVSWAQARSRPDLGFGAVIHNGIRLEPFERLATRESFLLFVGRMSPKKGVHLAARTARATSRTLLIAAKMTDPPEVAYFEHAVRPLLGEGVRFLGELDRPTLSGLYGQTAGLLMPLQWEEPFGLAMVEAMARGAPVVAMNRGAAPEIVNGGITGFLANDLDAFVDLIPLLPDIDPVACRRHVEERFAADRMVSSYETLYARVLARAAT